MKKTLLSSILFLFLFPHFTTVKAQSPGGVSTQLKTWYKADAGVQNAGVNANNNQAVDTWINQAGGTYNLSQATATKRPVYHKSTANQLINYNPSMRFDGADDCIGNDTRLMPSDSSYSFFIVALDSATDIGYRAYFSAHNVVDYFSLYKNGILTTDNSVIPYGILGHSATGGDRGTFGKGTTFGPNTGAYWNGTTFTRDAKVQKAQTQIIGMRSQNKLATDTLITYTDGYRSAPEPYWSYINEIPTSPLRSFHFGAFIIGADATSALNSYEHWRGNISEVIAYDRNITELEANKIQSYLAIKYGVTLGQGNGYVNQNGNDVNYIASNGTVIWNATANNTYDYDIFGIGQDNTQGLNQKQSKSINGGFQPAVSLNNGLAVTNADNANTFAADNSYWIAGHNGKNINFSNAYTPTVVSPSQQLYIMDRVWKVQETGTVGNVTITIPILNSIYASETYLVVSNSASFGTATEVLMTPDGNGNLTAQIDFQNGDYFTIAMPLLAPGAVTSQLRTWYKADAGVQSAGVNTTNNGSADTWLNQAVDGSYNLTQPTAANKPTYFNTTSNQQINFNPSLRFDGTNDYIRNTSRLMAQDSSYSFFIVAKDSSLDAGFRAFFSAHSVWDYFSLYKNGGSTVDNAIVPWGIVGNNIYGDRGNFGKGTSFAPLTGSYWNGSAFIRDSKVQKAQTQIVGMRSQNKLATDTLITYTDGYRNAPSPFWSYINENPASSLRQYHFGEFNVGADAAVASGIAEFWRGNISEVIAYDRNISEIEANKVQSYLAIKYGITLGQGNGFINRNGNNFSYLSSNGTVIWNATANTNYGYDIFGIGQDNKQGLNQKQSKSINGDFQPSVSLNNGLASNNALNTNSFAADSSFWVSGHNGLSTAFSVSYNPVTFDTIPCLYKMNRIWKVQETGTVGNVTITIPITDANTTTKTYMIVNSTDAFGAGTIEILMVPDGNGNLTARYDFNNGDYYSFIMPVTAPGGVTGNLVAWYKTNNNVLNTDGSSVSTWTNSVSGSTYNVTQAAAALQPKFYNTTVSKLVNYNPSLEFNGANALNNTGNPALFANTDGFEMFAVGVQQQTKGVPSEILGMGTDGNSPAFGMNAYTLPTASGWYPYMSLGGGGWTGSIAKLYNGYLGGNNQQAQIYGMSTPNGGTANVYSNVDGFREKTPISANNYATIGTNVYVGNTAGEFFKGLTNEIIIYNRKLDSLELLKVNSYLALKYGITLDQRQINDYTVSNGAVVYAASTFGAYDHDIAGVGIDSCAGLVQLKSTSANEDAVVTMTANSANVANLEFLVWANNDSSLTLRTSNLPTNLNLLCPSILNRTWHVQETGDVGLINLDFNLNKLPYKSSLSNWKLLIRNGNDNMSGATISSITPTLLNDSTIRFANVSFADGDYFTIAGNTIGPGGVLSSLKAWYKADNGVLAGNGTSVSTWTNSVGTYNLSSIDVSKPIFYNTTASKLVNGNPSVEFTFQTTGLRQRLNNASRLYANTDAFELLAVGVQKATYNTPSEITGVGIDGNYPAFGMNGYSTSGWYPWFSAGSTPIAYSNSNAILYNGFAGGTNQQAQIYGINSQNGGTDNVYTNVDGYRELTTLDANNQSEIGNGVFVGSSGDQDFTGLANEIIIYNRKLDSLELLKVHSYLAIKYGVTLDQRLMNDYVASSGTSIYAASTFGAYDHDIAGIGIDTCSGLVQLKSTSANVDAVVTMSANAANVANLEFLVWANNDSSLTPSELVNIPSGLPFSCPSRLERIWHVQETGEVGNVTLDFNIKNIAFIPSGGFRLLIKNGNDNMSTATVSSIIPTLIGDSIIRFTNVNLANNDYFTLAGNILAPGGVNNNLVAWYKSDDAASDVALSGSTVTQWNDIYGSRDLTRYSAVGTPTYRTSGTKLINYNNSVEFDNDAGNFQFFQNTSRYFPNTSGFHMITVGKDLENNTPYGVLRASAGMGDNGNYPGLDLESDVTHGWNFVMDLSSPTYYYSQGGTQSGYPLLYNGYTAGTNQQPQIYSVGSLNNVTTVGAANNIYSYIDGYKWLTDMDAYQQTPIGNYLYVGSSGGDAFWDGLIGEVLVYKGLLSDDEMLRVNTYLAIKYGITLNQSQYNDYTASNGTVVYAASTFGAYDHDIFGIGQDSCSGLIQKQSKSVNKGFQPAVSLNDGLATSNANNINSFAANNSFWVAGHNGQDTTFTDVYTPKSISVTSCLKIMDRVWHVQETGTINNVTITIPQFSAATASSTYLVIGNTDVFGTGTTEILMASDGSGNLTAQHNFTTGQYFSFVIPYAIVDTVNITDSICANTSIVFNNQTLTTSGTYLDTLTSANTGCDSIVRLRLTVLPLDSHTVVKSICKGDSVVVGTKVYKTSGTYTDTLRNANRFGCDSIIKLILTVNDIDTGRITQSICTGQSYTFNGQTLTIAGIYLDTLTSLRTSCDSIVKLTLSVNPIDTGRITSNICTGQSYTFNGQVLTTTGIYLDTLTSVTTGCDSIVKLTLTVDNIIKVSVSKAICKGDSVVSCSGRVFKISGVYLDTCRNSAGCDSATALTLTVNNIDTGRITQTICRGQSYTFNGQALTTAGIYLDTLTSPTTSCDSIVKLTLIVNPIDTGRIARSICRGQSYTFNGQALTTAGVYLDTLTSVATNCDSIVILTLTVNPIDTGRITRSICRGQSYTFNGQALTTAGVYLDTLTSVATSCDSIVKLTLTVNPIDTGRIAQTICRGQAYTFNGQALTTAGVYLDTLTSVATSCDSIVKLTLTVNTIDTGRIAQTICRGQSYTFNGQTLTTAGVYLDTLTSVVTSCDSIVKLTLTVNPIDTGRITSNICTGQSYTFNGQVLTTTGIYLDTLTSVTTGCDSIVKLTLTVDDVIRVSVSKAICKGDSVVSCSGRVFKIAGIYIDTCRNTAGCDSVTTLTLTVNNIDTGRIIQSICTGQSYTFNGQTLTTAGIYLDTLTSVRTGCDSIVKLTLTVDNIIRVNVSKAICKGDSLILCNGRVLKIAGIYIDTCINTAGCDSVTTLTLTVNPIDTGRITQSICRGQSYTFNGQTLTTAGVYLDTLTSLATGCDSIVRLTLAVDNVIKVVNNVTLCYNDSIVMCSGRVYKTAGTYNDTCRTSGGCDSLITTIITLDLCIKDTVPIIPVCDTCAVTVCMDTIYDIVNGHWTLCDGSQSTTTGLGSYSINQTTGCITYTANGIIGKDTLCIIVCNAAQTTCDTIKPIVVIVPTIQTITDTIKVGETDSICVPIQANMTADSVSIIACNGTINNITQPTVISISANCVMIKYTGTSIGTDDVCVIVCDNDLQICDTTKVIIVVEPKDTIPIVTVCDTCTTTVCLDTIYNITNGHWTLCDGSTSATSGLGSYNIDTTTGCITYSANGIIGKDTLCIIVCDSTRTTCDSVPIIIDVVCSVPQQILVDTVICSNKPIVINGQTISTAGTYNIRFTAHNTCDSIVTYRVTTVDCGCELAKGFSPNGDGVNDLYVIKCLSDLSIDGKVMFRVYNRWGIEVYRNNVYDNTFDGNYRGSPLPDGTYFFVLEYTNKLNQAINVSSYITIQR